MEHPDSTAYRIVDRDKRQFVGSYSRGYHNEYDFSSVEHARNANCHDMFMDKKKYAIAKYRVIYELVDPDCDGDKNGS